MRPAAVAVTNAGRRFTHFDGRFFEFVKLAANALRKTALAGSSRAERIFTRGQEEKGTKQPNSFTPADGSRALAFVWNRWRHPVTGEEDLFRTMSGDSHVLCQ